MTELLTFKQLYPNLNLKYMTMNYRALEEFDSMADKESVLTQLGLTVIDIPCLFNKWYELMPLKLDKLKIKYDETYNFKDI